MGVHRRPVNISLSLEVIPRLRHSHRDLFLTPEIVMDVERLDILGDIVQNRVTYPQYSEVEVVMGEAAILEDVVVKVMVVTKSTGVAGKLELLQRNMVGETGRQVIGPIVMLSPGDLKQRHLMLLSQVIFWSVIAWLLYYLILDPHFYMYLPHLLLVFIYIVICLTCLFVFLLRWVSVL